MELGVSFFVIAISLVILLIFIFLNLCVYELLCKIFPKYEGDVLIFLFTIALSGIVFFGILGGICCLIGW